MTKPLERITTTSSYIFLQPPSFILVRIQIMRETLSPVQVASSHNTAALPRTVRRWKLYDLVGKRSSGFPGPTLAGRIIPYVSAAAINTTFPILVYDEA